MPGSFFDTNVLLYLASADTVKAERAEVILLRGGAISVQVLNEAANVLRRKVRLSWRETNTFLGLLRRVLTVHPVTIETHEAGMALAERYTLSLYDALIVAAAIRADCDVLWSEDLQHGLVLGQGVRVINPFCATA